MISKLKSLFSSLTSLCHTRVHCSHYIHSLTRRDSFELGVDKNIPSCHTPSVIPLFSMESTQSPNYSFYQSKNLFYIMDQVLYSPLSVIAFISLVIRQCDHLFNNVLLTEDEPSSPNRKCWDNFLQNGSSLTLSLKEWALIIRTSPFLVKYGKLTVVKTYYECIFISLNVKVVHLELVSNLISEAFIATLYRFIARRGYPTLIWSDHGTNFFGANREIKEFNQFLQSQIAQDTIPEFCSTRNRKFIQSTLHISVECRSPQSRASKHTYKELLGP